MLSPEHEIFCELLLKYANATKAYRGAGYHSENPGQCAHNLLRKPEIQEYIQMRKKAILENITFSREEMMQELLRCANQSAKDLVDDDENFLPISEMTVDAAATISGIEFMYIDEEVTDENNNKKKIKRAVIKKIRRVSKLDAISMLLRMTGNDLPQDKNKSKTPLTIDEIEIIDHIPESNEPADSEPKTPKDAD